MELAFQQIGSGEPVIILHGLFGMSDNWMSIAKSLSEEYTLYLLDLRNHGRSPHHEKMNFQLMARDVTEFIEAHNLEDVTLLGHSLGGKVAMQMAVNHALYLKKLVIVDIANKVYRTSYFEQYIEAMLSMDLKKINTRKDAEKAFLKHENVQPVVLQFLLKNLYRDKNNSFKWHLNLPALKENMDNLLQSVDIKAPVTTDTLFIKGADSGYITEEDESVIGKQFTHVKIVTIENANHWVHFTAAHNFLKALKHFQKN